MWLRMSVIIAAMAVGFTARAQQGTQQKLSKSDRDFVMHAARGGLAEVQMGNLASQKASDPEVKQFGERMVTDHTKANDDLKTMASQKNISLPTALDKKDQRAYDKLNGLSGSAFDKAYMDDMLKDHQHDVGQFARASKTAKDGDVRTFATNTLPTIQDHLKMATEIRAKTSMAVGGSGNSMHHRSSP